MSHDPQLTRRLGTAFAAATVLGTLNACGSDSESADTTAAADTTTSTVGTQAATAEFANLGDDESITTTEYVGEIEGTGIYAAFAISRTKDGDALRSGKAYFCDGTTIANWFRLVDGDGLTFKNSNGDTFEGELADDGTLTAEVTLGGTKYTVSAAEVDADGDAGLYLADHAIDADLANDERGGWIVLPDGSQRGAIRAGTTILPGTSLTADTGNVVVAGRDILLRAITHIIGLGSCI